MVPFLYTMFFCWSSVVGACVRAFVYLLTLERACMHVYVYVCIYRKWMCLHVCMFVSIYVCMHVWCLTSASDRCWSSITR